MNRAERYRLNGRAFVRRWTMHILPKGFIRSRSYGGYHNGKRDAYLQQCRDLLAAPEPSMQLEQSKVAETPMEAEAEVQRKCPQCQESLTIVSYERRPSWRKIFEERIYGTSIYSPMHHIGSGRAPLGGS